MTRYAPFRFFALWATVLVVAAAMASSSARAFALGEASALSALGEPLRAVIPVTPTAGETIIADCFALVPPGDGSGAPLVTAKVSLERAAAGPQLVVTTPQGLNEPVLRLAIRAGCEAQTRRDYVLLLDPPPAGYRTTDHAAATKANAPAVRAPGQESSAAAAATSAAARRDMPERSGTGTVRLAQRPVGAGYPPVVLRYAKLDETASNGSFQHAATGSESQHVTPIPRYDSIAIDRSKDLWWTIAVAIGGLVIVVLGAIVVREGRSAPRSAPAWSSASMRSRTHTRARSVTNLAAAPVTLAHSGMPTDALLTRAAPTTRAWVAPATAVTLPNLPATANTRSRANPPRVSGAPDRALDTLLNEIDADLNVEQAVRQMHAIAHSNDLARDFGSDAILKAIEAAERDLMLAPLPPAENALGHALDSELLGGKPRQKKAAA